jgi:hypothetical protein
MEKIRKGCPLTGDGKQLDASYNLTQSLGPGISHFLELKFTTGGPKGPPPFFLKRFSASAEYTKPTPNNNQSNHQ